MSDLLGRERIDAKKRLLFWSLSLVEGFIVQRTRTAGEEMWVIKAVYLSIQLDSVDFSHIGLAFALFPPFHASSYFIKPKVMSEIYHLVAPKGLT